MCIRDSPNSGLTIICPSPAHYAGVLSDSAGELPPDRKCVMGVDVAQHLARRVAGNGLHTNLIRRELGFRL